MNSHSIRPARGVLTLFALVSVCTLFGAISCGPLDPRYPISKATYIGHAYEEVSSAIKEGRVQSVLVSTAHETGELTSLFLELNGGEQWALSGSDHVAASLALIDGYNAAVPEAARVVVKRQTSYGAPSPVSPRPSPTSNP